MPLRDPLWEHFNDQDFPNSSPGRYLAPYEDYIDAMRSPSANGDELSARLHFLWCAYCHFWLAQENNRQAFLFDMQADFHPPNVSRARHLLLVHLPGHYQWAHPHRDDCFHHERASPLGFPLGSLMPFIGKVMDDWTHPSSTHLHHPPPPCSAQLFSGATCKLNIHEKIKELKPLYPTDAFVAAMHQHLNKNRQNSEHHRAVSKSKNTLENACVSGVEEALTELLREGSSIYGMVRLGP